MRRLPVFIALLVSASALLAASTALAQTSPNPVPDAGVRGSGAIPPPYGGALGVFDVNAARSGDVLFGGFRYQELRPDGTRGQVIYSQAVTGLRVLGNTATVDAVGYWNNMLCDLTIEALDDLSGDWFHITARPRGPLTIIYDQAGGLI